MYKPFILLLGMFLASHVRTAAQTLAPTIVPAQERIALNMTMVPTVSAPLHAASFQFPEGQGKSNTQFSYLFGRTYDNDQGLEGLKRLWPMREVKALFLTQSMLPLVHLFGGRLRLEGFTSTLHTQNVQRGPSAAGGLLDFRPPRQGYLVGPRSVGLYGISLSFHFGRDAQVGRPTQIWRCVTRIVGAAR